ncbi:MAG: DUF370 domain-containing protein [Clostridiales bacterium]|jgi:regulator of extracellular matrix RemA (YlzA/DUF370 family)|nr:DUF370 domain-containing protein [Clostridiales bacterium]
MKFVDIGFGNTVNTQRVIGVVSPDSLPVRRLIQDAKNINRVIDVSCGKKTRAVIITDSEHIILSAEEVNVIAERMNSQQ